MSALTLALTGPLANGESLDPQELAVPEELRFQQFSPMSSLALSDPPRIEGEDDPEWVGKMMRDIPPGNAPGGNPAPKTGVPLMEHCVICGRDAAQIPENLTVDSLQVKFCPGHMARPVFEVLMQLSAIRYNAAPADRPPQ
jgi:hypothetical protein